MKNNRITLPHGLAYRVLVLLPDHKTRSLVALETVVRLVGEGATVIGLKFETTDSLVGYPASETRLKQLADALWNSQHPSRSANGWGRAHNLGQNSP